MSELFRNRKNTMSVSTIHQFERHGGSAVNGVHVSAGRTESAMATEWNEFPFVAVRTDVHGTAKRSITTVNHFFNIFNDGFTWMKCINHFFIMVNKNVLKFIHTFIMKET